MKRTLYRNELLWVMIIGGLIWNIALTFRASPQTIVTLDRTKVVRVAAQQLADVSTVIAGETSDITEVIIREVTR